MPRSRSERPDARAHAGDRPRPADPPHSAQPTRPADPSRPASPTRPALIAGVVVAGCAVVALGAAGLGMMGMPAEPSPEWSRALRRAGALAVALGLAGLLLLRPRLRPRNRHDGDPTVTGLAAAGILMVLLALMARFAPDLGIERPIPERVATDLPASVTISEDAEGPPPPAEPDGTGPPRPVLPPGEDEGLDPGPPPPSPYTAAATPATIEEADTRRADQVARLLVFLLVAALLAIGFLALAGLVTGRRYRTIDVEAPPEALDPLEAAAGLDASLAALAEAGGDPRERIAVAYRRLLEALAAAGAPGRPEEAPHEHLQRTLGVLGIDPIPLHRLADLYVRAGFSDRPVTDAHRSAAADALAASLAHLRPRLATARAPGNGGGRAP